MPSFHQIPSLLLNEEKLADLIAVLPFSAHVRDVGNDRYILANEFQAKNCGLHRSDEVIGMKPNQLVDLEKRNLIHLPYSLMLSDQNYDMFRKMNYLVEKGGEAVSFKEKALINSGYVYLGNTFKWPILNQNGKVMAVFTLSIETTQHTNLLKLYSLYRRYLPKKTAINQILQYLEIRDYFYQNPTEAELITLLNMQTTSFRKLIAQQLNVQPVTVATHIQRLRKKLKGAALENVVILLRKLHYTGKSFTYVR